MKTTLSSFFLLVLTNSAISQVDTIKAADSILSLEIEEAFPANQLFLMDCAHGHICCAVGCECCAELHREQKYDRIDKKVTEGIQRTILGERYRIAASNGRAAIQVKYVHRGKLIGHYFSTELPKFEEDYRKRYSWSYEHLDFSKPYEFVFDSTGEFHLVDLKGVKQEIDFQHKYEVSDGIYQVFAVTNCTRIFGLQRADGSKITGLKYKSIEQVDNGQFIVQNHNFRTNTYTFSSFGAGAGVINDKGEVILETDFDEIAYIGANRYRVLKNGNWYLYDDSGRALSDGYSYLGKHSHGLIAFRKDKKLGFLNSDGEIEIRSRYDWVYDFNDNRAAVFLDDKWGFMDQSGEQIIERKYDKVRNFNSAMAPVAIGPNSNSDHWIILDERGIPIQTNVTIDDVDGCKGGFCRFFVNGSGDGILNSKGKVLIDPHYDILDYGTEKSWFVHGRVTVRDYQNDRKMFWINEKGRKMKELPKLDYVRPLFAENGNLSENLLSYYLFNKNAKWGLADLNGDLILPMKYEHIQSWTSEYVLLMDNSKIWSYHLKSGKKTLIGSGSVRERTKDGVVKIERDDQQFYYTVNGKKIEDVKPTEQ